GAQARSIAEAAHRHPSLIAELCQTATAAEAGGKGASDLDTLFQQRLERLPGAARRLLEACAIAGFPLPRGLAIAASATTDPSEALDDPQALPVLVARRLLRSRPVPGGEDLSLYHPTIGDVVTSRMEAAAKRARHLGLARALEQSGNFKPEL